MWNATKDASPAARVYKEKVRAKMLYVIRPSITIPTNYWGLI